MPLLIRFQSTPRASEGAGKISLLIKPVLAPSSQPRMSTRKTTAATTGLGLCLKPL